MAGRRWLIVETWRARLWPFPALGVVAAVALGVALPGIDARMDARQPRWYLFGGGPDVAKAILSSIAGSLITATSLMLSLTVVTLQLASSQYSPRLLRTFTKDPFIQATLTVLLGTFVYSVTVLRSIRSTTGSGFVPHLAITVAYVFALASVVSVLLFLAHLAKQIRIESMFRTVHAETTGTLRLLAKHAPGPDSAELPLSPTTGVVHLCAASSGFLVSVDERSLLTAARRAGAVVVLDRFPGDSVIAGTPIAVAWPLENSGRFSPDAVEALTKQVNDSVRTGTERTPVQDPAFGLRQLVDVAVKALSPGINDPTTAVHALSHASAILCHATRCGLGPQLLYDDAGRVRVVLPRPELSALLDLVVTQPRRYGAADPDVLGRLLILLREVAWTRRSPEHHRAVTSQLARVRATARRQNYDEDELRCLDRLARLVEQAIAGRWPLHDDS
jgi:uncharacterized membrane protein